MPTPDSKLKFESAEVLLPGEPLVQTLAFFADELGFRVDSIYPADAPRVAVVSGYGVRLRLDCSVRGDPGTVRLTCPPTTENLVPRIAPNGTAVEFYAAEASLELPPPKSSLIVLDAGENDGFSEGRAGMQYRDLIPDRYGGRFIASHIRIVDGGPVADYVHHHHILFQLIFCVRGWVSVVYEDQGPPILLEPGDCFLQPPHIRHRVLESSDNMEVVEVSCPAEHETLVDHEMKLPTAVHKPERDFSGQRFVYHDSSEAQWVPWHSAGFEQQDAGIEAATNGIASAAIVRASATTAMAPLQHDGALRFLFVLQGKAILEGGRKRHALSRASSCAIPGHFSCELADVSADFRMLEVFVPSQ